MAARTGPEILDHSHIIRPQLCVARGGTIASLVSTLAAAFGASRRRGAEHKGGDVMGRVTNELVLLSCMATFVTGVVIAAASIIG